MYTPKDICTGCPCLVATNRLEREYFGLLLTQFDSSYSNLQTISLYSL